MSLPPPSDPQQPPIGPVPPARRRGRRWADARVTQAIVIATVACWLVGLIPGVDLAYHLGFAPAMSAAEPWRALTVVLVHDSPSPLHLLFNMVGVFIFGGFLERALGPWRLLTVYVLSALGGSAAVLLTSSPMGVSWITLHVGASGALFGLLGVVLVPTRKLDRNMAGAVAFLALNLVFTFATSGVSWQSHLGGLLVGFTVGCAALLPPSGKRSAGSAQGALTDGTGPARAGSGPGSPPAQEREPAPATGAELASGAAPASGAERGQGPVREPRRAARVVASVWFWPASLIVAATLVAASWPFLRTAALLT